VGDIVAVPRSEAWIVELPEDPEKLRFGDSRNHSRIRWAVNKATREGVRVRDAAGAADLHAWYGLYCQTLRRHAVPPHPYRFFSAIWDELSPRGMARLLLAERSTGQADELLAGALLLMHGDTVWYAFSGSRRGSGQHRPNDLIQWHALHEACSAGFRRYDLGAGLESDAGLDNFKRKWGATAEPRFRSYFPAPRVTDGGVDLRLELYRERGGAVRRLAESLWRRLPLGATALLGGVFYRYL
jgi:lipid II:glycine glycyltransferase (peptidoglycan interpeptide bridge formation enzyme)